MWPFGFGNKYPYTDFHELNADWILNKIGILEDSMRKFIIDTKNTIIDTVNKWLDDHPEATTTVQDGAITYEKLNNTLIDRLRFNSKYPLFGNYRNATAGGSLISNNIQWGVNGDGTAETLAEYYNRDAVVNANITVNDVPTEYVIGKQYGISGVSSTSVVLDSTDDYPIVGMVVQLFNTISNDLSSDSYVGVITDVNENTLTVNKWYKMGDSSTPVIPQNVNYAIVNIITRLYGNLIQMQDKDNAGKWYRESFGISTEIYSENNASLAAYGNVVYIRSAKANDVIAFYANNASEDIASSAFSVAGTFRDALVIKGERIIDGDGRLMTPKVNISNNTACPVIVVTNGLDLDTLDIPENSEVLLLNNTSTQVSITSSTKPFRKRTDSTTLYIDAYDCVRAVITGSYVFINKPNDNLTETDLYPNTLVGNLIRTVSDFVINDAFANVRTLKEFIIMNTSGTNRTLSVTSGYCFVNGQQVTSITANARSIMHGVYNPAGPTFFISSSN